MTEPTERVSILTPDNQHELNIELLKSKWTRFENRMQGIDAIGQLGLKSLIILNGGAIVASFTVLEHWKDVGVSPALVVGSFGWFIGGLVTAMLAILAAYLSQNAFAMNEAYFAMQTFEQISLGKVLSVVPARTRIVGHGFYVAIICAIASLVCFSIGSYHALTAAPTAAHKSQNIEAKPSR